MKKLAGLMALMMMSTSLSGCLLGAAAGAGYVAHDEATENDGEFDPLEEAYDGDPSTAGPLDDDD
ncbi:hypothetical protein [Hyphococcus sp.]|uniref:hypothetical protein n=1 Tax=Hyphococcus sp. TaxID=2038636 RepID=UPI0035C75CD2